MAHLWHRLWSVISTILVAPFLLPIVLVYRIAISTLLLRGPSATAPKASPDDFARSEYLFLLGGILVQENSIIGILRGLTTGQASSSTSDPLSLGLSSATLIGTFVYCGRHRAAIFLALSRNLLLLPLPLLNILSTAWSMDPATTLKRGILTAGALLFWLYCAVRLTPSQALGLLSKTVIFAAWASLFVALALPNFGRELGADMAGEWRGIFTHKNALGQFMSMGVDILMFQMILARKVTRAGIIHICLCILLMELSKSTTSLVSSVIAAVGGSTYLLALRGADGRLLIGGAVLTGLLLLGIITLIDPAAPFALLGKDTTLTGRTELWEYVNELIHERPYLGWGYKAMWSPDANETTYIWNQIKWDAPEAHNGYLEVGLSLGRAGWFALAVMLGACILRAFRCLETRNWLLATMLCTFVAQQLFINLTESVFNDTTAFGWALTMFIAFYAGYTLPPTKTWNRIRRSNHVS